MHPFEPLNERKFLRDPAGTQRLFVKSIDEEQQHSALGRTAGSMVSTAIRCILVGFRDEARELLLKAKKWLELAIKECEEPRLYSRGATEAERYGDLALCNWLLQGVHDHLNSTKMIEERESWRADKGDLDKTDVGYLLPKYIDARCYRKAQELFLSTPGMKVPHDSSSVRNEGDMSYIIASAHERTDFADADVATILDSFLHKSLGKLVAGGHFCEAARWMKIAYSNEDPEPCAPEIAILKCYGFLPGVDFPGYDSSN